MKITSDLFKKYINIIKNIIKPAPKEDKPRKCQEKKNFLTIPKTTLNVHQMQFQISQFCIEFSPVSKSILRNFFSEIQILLENEAEGDKLSEEVLKIIFLSKTPSFFNIIKLEQELNLQTDKIFTANMNKIVYGFCNWLTLTEYGKFSTLRIKYLEDIKDIELPYIKEDDEGENIKSTGQGFRLPSIFEITIAHALTNHKISIGDYDQILTHGVVCQKDLELLDKSNPLRVNVNNGKYAVSQKAATCECISKSHGHIHIVVNHDHSS